MTGKLNLAALFVVLMTVNYAYADHVFLKCIAHTQTGQKLTVAGAIKLQHFIHYRFDGVMQLGDDPKDTGTRIGAGNLSDNQVFFNASDTANNNSIQVNIPAGVVRTKLHRHDPPVPLNDTFIKILKINGFENPQMVEDKITCSGTITKQDTQDAKKLFGDTSAGVLSAILGIVLQNLGAMHQP